MMKQRTPRKRKTDWLEDIKRERAAARVRGFFFGAVFGAVVPLVAWWLS